MLSHWRWKWAVALIAVLAAVAPRLAQAQPRTILQISLTGALTPAAVSYVQRGIATAERDGAAAVVLVLNTPGGRLDWMQQIVSALRASRVPVVVYVSPRGAAAASAGTLITLAAHAAAMAPETTLGAASPVGGGGAELDETEARKVKEDMRALARGLTERRGQAASTLAEAMIEEARSVSPREARAAGLIDFVAADLDDLLRQLDGFTVEAGGQAVTLRTAGAVVRRLDMSPIEQWLTWIADPNVAALLLFIGAQALLIELANPGGWLPGFVGVLCLALAVYGLGILPVNWFGLVLIVVAFVLFVVDIKAPTHGVLTAAGALTLMAGLWVLFSAPGIEQYGRLSLPLVIALGAGSALFFAFIVAQGLRAQRARPVTGVEGIIGATGVARGDLAPEGQVLLHGERWQATVDQGEVKDGGLVEVISVDGLRLRVRPAEEARR